MNRSSHSLSLLFVIISFMSVSSQPDTIAQSEANFLVYTNTDLGFTLEYPDNWRVIEDISPDTVYVTPKENQEPLPSTGVIAGFTPAENPNSSLQELGNKIVETNRNSKYATGFRLVEMNTNSHFLGGHPAVRIVFVSTVDGDEKKSVALGNIVNGKEYGLMTFSDVVPYSDYSPIFQHMIETFQIIETQ